MNALFRELQSNRTNTDFTGGNIFMLHRQNDIVNFSSSEAWLGEEKC